MRAPHEPRFPVLSRRRLLLGGAGVVGLAGSGVAAYAASEAFDLHIARYRLVPAGWPAGFKLTMAAVADVHAGGPNMTPERIQRVVEKTNALNADVIVLLGDYGAHHRFLTEVVSYDACIAALSRLKAPLGVFAIYGNHDWWYGIDDVRTAFARSPIPVLENSVVALGSGPRRFWLAGLGDQLAHRIGPRRFRGVDDLPGTLAKVTDDAPVILLAHEPDIFPQVPARVALTLSGHTHGGQVRLPLVWPWFVPSRYGARYAYGHVVEDARHLIVSGGLGTSIAPVRLGVPPEIVHIELGG